MQVALDFTVTTSLTHSYFLIKIIAQVSNNLVKDLQGSGFIREIRNTIIEILIVLLNKFNAISRGVPEL